MIVRLPRQRYSGREIVADLKKASSFLEHPDKKWEAEGFIEEFQYDLDPLRQTERSVGLKISSFSLRKKWIFFGKKIWRNDNNPTFTLSPLILKKRYKEFNLKIRYSVYSHQDGSELVVTGPQNKEFEEIRPIFEEILKNFFRQLQS